MKWHICPPPPRGCGWVSSASSLQPNHIAHLPLVSSCSSRQPLNLVPLGLGGGGSCRLLCLFLPTCSLPFPSSSSRMSSGTPSGTSYPLLPNGGGWSYSIIPRTSKSALLHHSSQRLSHRKRVLAPNLLNRYVTIPLFASAWLVHRCSMGFYNSRSSD